VRFVLDDGMSAGAACSHRRALHIEVFC